MAMAGRDAIVPANGAGALGSAQQPAGKSDRACVVLRARGDLDDFLKEAGIYEETQAQAIKQVVAWQLAEAMKARKLSRARLAVLLKTSRTQVNRLLDPTQDITLSSLQRAAKLVGRRVHLELV
jgi:antitoxin HicB